ncbi:UDP-N-acetylglucosamine 2-epimerase [Verrucomicrobia bacterium]|nr:UDP-N-acetylglucosamine 2-epimerase [Verrucomicrobiota bacterium]
MVKKRKICVVTGTRAEIGLLHFLMEEINNSEQLELQVIATGMHLSPEFGLTHHEITKAGFFINRKVEMLLSSDTPVGVTKSIGLAVIGFADAFNELCPDFLILLGDRFELLAAASAAMVARIPIAHIHGGETSEGAIDEAIRHSITKMSHLHFTATEDYRKRVIQLGEAPDTVFNVGGMAMDYFGRIDFLDRAAFESAIRFELGERNAIVTFHPVTLEKLSAEKQFRALLQSLDEFGEMKVIITKPNADTDGRILIKMIDEYVARNPSKAIAFVSLGQLRYLSALRHMDVVVGNSSSGLLEAPSFKVATVNIGDRQKGRIKATSVIDCPPKKDAITMGIKRGLSNEFRSILKETVNPYGVAGAAKKIRQKLETIEASEILKKQFYNLK